MRMTKITMIRTYSELIRIPIFEDRFEYLKLHGEVGKSTFGFDRYLNQKFYRSKEWRQLRNEVILRDCGCDMALQGYEIADKIIIHHMNPIILQNIVDRDEEILNPDYLVCVSPMTHNAIHYGDFSLIDNKLIERKPGDTLLWHT